MRGTGEKTKIINKFGVISGTVSVVMHTIDILRSAVWSVFSRAVLRRGITEQLSI